MEAADKLHGDKGYDHRRCRRECRIRGIKPRIARRGIESSQKLGRHRWVVERTHAWLNQFRRLTVRYEQRTNLHLALTTLACAVICLRQVRRFCPCLQELVSMVLCRLSPSSPEVNTGNRLAGRRGGRDVDSTTSVCATRHA